MSNSYPNIILNHEIPSYLPYFIVDTIPTVVEDCFSPQKKKKIYKKTEIVNLR